MFCMHLGLILHLFCSVLLCHATKPSQHAWFLWVSVSLASLCAQVKHIDPAVAWSLTVCATTVRSLAVTASSRSVASNMCMGVCRRRALMRCRSPYGLYLVADSIIFIWPPCWCSFWEHFEQLSLLCLYFFSMIIFKLFVEVVGCFVF